MVHCGQTHDNEMTCAFCDWAGIALLRTMLYRRLVWRVRKHANF